MIIYEGGVIMNEPISCIVTTKSLFERINYEIPGAKFCAKYRSSDADMMENLRQYRDQPFVYLLTTDYEDKKCVIYVGKSYAQYTRMLLHKAAYEFDELFLYEVSEKDQKAVEDMMIEYFRPLYNKVGNLEQYKIMDSLGVDYEEYKSRERIHEDIQLMLNNIKMESVTYFLPRKYIYALDMQAKQQQTTGNQLLGEILEKELPKELILESVRNNEEELLDSEMVTVHEYAEMWNRSVEQIKVHCRNGRLCARKQGRDWAIPRSVPYPEDRRKR